MYMYIHICIYIHISRRKHGDSTRVQNRALPQTCTPCQICTHAQQVAVHEHVPYAHQFCAPFQTGESDA